MKVTILIMLPFYFGPVRPDIILTPENEALRRGASTELICRVNSGSSVFSWTFTAYQSSTKDVTIYNREIEIVSNMTSFRKTADTDGFLNIKTDSAQPQDAGVYTCNILLQEVKGIRIEQRSAHLIVLDSDPNCTGIDYSTNGRKFKQLSCSVGFNGNWAPVMEWRQGGFNGQIVTTGVQSNTLSNFVTSSLTIPVEDRVENTFSYTCVTLFSAHMGNVNATAANIPNYTFIWPGPYSDKIDHLIEVEPITKTTQTSEIGNINIYRFTELNNSNVSPGELPVPANAVVIQGSKSKMICKTSSTSTVNNWTFTAAGSSAAVVIYSREKGMNRDFPRHEHGDDYTSCKLSIESTQTEHAGTYTCTKPDPKSHSSGIVQESAQLIVFESDPKCSEDERQEDINDRREKIFNLRCTVAFRGNWTPLMEWRFNDAHGEIIEQGVSKSTVFNRNVTSGLRLVASSTRQNAKYICRTFFGNINSNLAGSAKNIPDYNYTWTSSVINESNDVSLVTLIVSLAAVVIAILVALIVYHMFFKSFLADRHRVPPVSAIPSFQTVQESDYTAIRETGTSTDLNREPPNEQQIPGTIQEDIYDSVAYGDLQVREDTPPHYYRKLPSALPPSEGSYELHPYVNVPVMVDLSTPSAAIRPDGNI